MTRPEIALALPDRDVAAFARRAEERGADALVALPGGRGDALVALAYAAGATERIRLATAGLSLSRRDVAVLAREARTLDDLAGGRVTLGVTAGGDGLAPALTRGDGRVFDARLEALRTSAAAALPLLIGGSDRRTLDRVARVGDGWIAPAGASVQDVARGRAALLERWGDRGGAPRIVVVLEADVHDPAARIAALGEAGATTVVLAATQEVAIERLALAA